MYVVFNHMPFREMLVPAGFVWPWESLVRGYCHDEHPLFGFVSRNYTYKYSCLITTLMIMLLFCRYHSVPETIVFAVVIKYQVHKNLTQYRGLY